MSHKNYSKIIEWHDAQSGFLYYPRDQHGNYFNSTKTGDYPQINFLKTGANGFVGIQKDVQLNSNNSYWTDGKRLVANSLRNGKPFLGDDFGSYSFDNGRHYFVAKELPHSFADPSVEIRVYNYQKQLIQTFNIPNILTIRCFQANKSADEFLILGNLQSLYSPVEKPLPFAFNTADYADDNPYYGASALANRMRLKWEGIARYSIIATENPSEPYSFSLVDYKEQWRGFAYQLDTTQEIVDESVLDNYTKITTTTESVADVHYFQDVVLDCYYDADVYKERIFAAGAYTETSTTSNYHFADLFYLEPVFDETIQNSSKVSWNFAIDNQPCSYQSNSNVSLHGYGESFQPVLMSSFTHHHDFTANWQQLDALNPYSNVKPTWTISASDEYSSSGELPDLQINEEGGLYGYTIPTGEPAHFNRSIVNNNVIIFPTKNHSFAIGGGLAFDLLASVDSSVGIGSGIETAAHFHRTRWNPIGFWEGYDDKNFTYIDPLKFFIKPVTLVFTDKFNNHLLVWNDSPDYTPAQYAPTKAKIVNHQLANVVDLSTKIPFTFFAHDFIGAV